eukprot:10082579-Karenia_brevis.AAC.1
MFRRSKRRLWEVLADFRSKDIFLLSDGADEWSAWSVYAKRCWRAALELWWGAAPGSTGGGGGATASLIAPKLLLSNTLPAFAVWVVEKANAAGLTDSCAAVQAVLTLGREAFLVVN